MDSADQSGPVGEDDGLDPVSDAELREDPCDMGLDRGLARKRCAAISALDSPSAMRVRTSVSRAVRSDRQLRPAGRGVRGRELCRSAAGSSLGASSASPALATWMAWTSWLAGASLRRKPLAPARERGVDVLVEVEGGQDHDLGRGRVVARSGGWPRARPCRGIRMSISTTSGCSRSTWASASARRRPRRPR